MELNANTSGRHDVPFIDVVEAAASASKRLNRYVDPTTLEILIGTHLLPSYADKSDSPSKSVLLDDLIDLLPVVSSIQSAASPAHPSGFYLSGGGQTAIVGTTSTMQVRLGDALAADRTLACGPASRNMFNYAACLPLTEGHPLKPYPFYGDTTILSNDPSIGIFTAQQLARSTAADPELQPDFARTAHYMGSKRRLGAFITEAIASKLPPGQGVVLDLMCGSGAAASIFNRVWPTCASDALGFCRSLARVQGGAYSPARAEQSLAHILSVAREHFNLVSKKVGVLVELENNFFHDDIGPGLLVRYQQFIRDTPLYNGSAALEGWEPTLEVRLRQSDPTLQPYCLFTAYFANIYFGFRQCVEIDSLRFAISTLSDPDDQEWALGALVVALSSLATTYAAHFAQPLLRDPDDLTLSRLTKILERRAQSIQHEFSVRLRNLAAQSASTPRSIQVLPGPWQTALESFVATSAGKPAVVYLDAPYTRDEYSRYYHVLETLIRYSYPTCNGRGRVPSRHVDLFASEFFTKTQSKVEKLLENIISQILQHGWTCAWSYSNSAAARITAVIRTIHTLFPQTTITSYSVPYKHKSHGPRPHKSVTEYLIMFDPK